MTAASPTATATHTAHPPTATPPNTFTPRPPTLTPGPACENSVALSPKAGIVTYRDFSFSLDPTFGYSLTAQTCAMALLDGELAAAYTFFTDPLYTEHGDQLSLQPEIMVVALTAENLKGRNAFFYTSFARLPELQKITNDEQAATWHLGPTLNVRPHYLATPTLTGVRAIIDKSIDTYFFTNEVIVYAFDGITRDGRYYVGFRIPVDAPFLLTMPAHALDPISGNINPNAIPIPEWPRDLEARFQIVTAYNQEAIRRFEQITDADMVPNLAQLDAWVSSLQIAAP